MNILSGGRRGSPMVGDERDACYGPCPRSQVRQQATSAGVIGSVGWAVIVSRARRVLNPFSFDPHRLLQYFDAVTEPRVRPNRPCYTVRGVTRT